MKRLIDQLFNDPKFKKGSSLLVEAIQDLGSSFKKPKPGDPEYLKTLSNWINELRGRPLIHPAIGSGMGQGVYQEMADGSIKIDFTTNIGVYFFGHNDPDLVETAIQAACKDVAMQGTIQQLEDYGRFLEILIKNAGGRIVQGWPCLTGSDANDNALKIIRQKKSPASKIISFQHSFHGRNTGLMEITDNPLMREGQPTFGVVHYIPFYNPKEGDASIKKSLKALRDILEKEEGKIAGFIFELMQGEGGFRFAPREFFVPLMEECKKEGIAVWIDEVQTCGRTGELFAYQTFKLEEYIDVVTCGKMFQNCATLWTKEYAPKPGLIAGTFGGSTSSLMVGRRIIERLLNEGFLGPRGKIVMIGERVKKGLNDLNKRLKRGRINQIEGIGCMVAFIPNDGSALLIDALIQKAFENGLILWKAGRFAPFQIRLMIPGGSLTEEGLEQALDILATSLD